MTQKKPKTAKLTDDERELLDRLRGRLQDQGVRVSDDGVVLALIKALATLPEDELLRLLKNSLHADGERDC